MSRKKGFVTIVLLYTILRVLGIDACRFHTLCDKDMFNARMENTRYHMLTHVTTCTYLSEQERGEQV